MIIYIHTQSVSDHPCIKILSVLSKSIAGIDRTSAAS
jgi:hypothetical protein